MRWIAAVALCLAVAGGARADDWSPQRDPFDPVVIQRYEAILAREPHDESALRQLVAMYQRYRTVAKLEAEYRARLDAGEDWATLVVLARLPRSSKPDTAALWKRALAVKPDDGLAWLAAGDAAASDAAAARDAYLRAAKLLAAPARKRVAWTKLVSAARIVGDAAAVDEAYAGLIALSPNDGTLWLDRGGAQVVAKHFAAALDSFATSEPLLRTDPERQLQAMTGHAGALQALGRSDEAIAEYEHVLDKAPSGYYLRQDVVAKIVDVERQRGRLAGAIALLEKRWPERTRGYLEWATLADLYKESGNVDGAIDAYRRALAHAPTEVTTQRKLIALLDQHHPDQALAQHEAAARVAPGDADLQLALAKRYHPAQDQKAFATLDALSRRMSRNVGVRSAIAALCEQWNAPARAIVEYEGIVAAEPDEPDHAIVLGEAYWRADDQPKARKAWDRLDKINTSAALLRHGDVLALHDEWNDALTAYSKSVALDATNVDAWYGRARAYDSLSKFDLAVDDARRAVALTANATQADGLRNRQLLARVLGHAYAHGDHGLEASVAKWRFAFDRDDAAAGYMLAAHHARLGSYQLHDVLLRLHQLVPEDESLTIALSRSFVRRRDFVRARAELEAIARRTPARADDVAKLVAEVERDRVRAENAIRWEEEGRAPGLRRPDLVGRNDRSGMRLELGGDLDDRSAAELGLGFYVSKHLAEGTAYVVRFDWTQRSGQMNEVDAYAVGASVMTRLWDARKFELAIAAGPRLELRYGREGPGDRWGRGGVSADAALELLPRAFPVTVGVRFDRTLTDSPNASALWLELGVEVR